MKLDDIYSDAVRYPFLGTKNVLILGIINFIGLYIGLTSLFLNGYQFRIIKSSLNGDTEPPEFNNWDRMLLDGVKVYLVSLVYVIPTLVIIIIFGVLLLSTLDFLSNISFYNSTISIATIVAGFLVIAYLIIIIPLIMMAIAYMADNNGEIGAAFRFREILDKIASLGWINLTKWSITTIIPVVIIFIAAMIASIYISEIIQLPLEKFLVAIILAPLFMYFSRSFSLFYMSGNSGYLECENCGGYYELQHRESPEDFDKCQCGGNLKYIQSMPSDNDSDDLDTKNMGRLRSMLSFNKKRDLIIIILIALGIIATPFLIYSHALTPTPIKYTLIGSYNVNTLGDTGKDVNLPQGTKNIKVDYNISWKNVETGTNGLNLDTYDINIGTSEPTGMLNLIDQKYVEINKGQNKIGTYYFNDPPVKSISLDGNGIQGTVKIYTSK